MRAIYGMEASGWREYHMWMIEKIMNRCFKTYLKKRSHMVRLHIV
jgi:hypothetical protein